MGMVSTPIHLLPCAGVHHVLPLCFWLLCTIHCHVAHSLISEACVRGHRASRCDHFDRWMVRVKKPGRPLRDCPHATGPCTCSQEKATMMKIPIKGSGQILPEDLFLKLLKGWAA